MTMQFQLDPAIRDWVLIPVVFVMILVGVLRDKVPNCSFAYSPEMAAW